MISGYNIDEDQQDEETKDQQDEEKKEQKIDKKKPLTTRVKSIID